MNLIKLFFCIIKNWVPPSTILAIIWSTLKCQSQFMFWALINCCFYVGRPNLESLSCRLTYFLCWGTGVAFLAFLSLKTKNTDTHEFSLPSNPKKLKKLWKFDFFPYLAFVLAFKKILAFFQFFWPFDTFCSCNFWKLS